MPYVEPALVEYLLSQTEGVDADVAVPAVRGYLEPLCAVYRRTCLGPIEKLIERGVLKVSELYDLVCVRAIAEEQVREYDPKLRSFVNLNGPAAIRLAPQRRHRQYR